jgi:hypothetical protein
MGCVVTPADDRVVLLAARERLGVTAALAVTAVRETKVVAKRKNLTIFLPRALQRCVRTRVLSSDTIFPGCLFEKAALLTAKFELQLPNRLFNFFCDVT